MQKLGRNDKCHCGSEKKYKKCCLQKDEQSDKNPFTSNEKPKLAWETDEEWEDAYSNDFFNEEEDEEFDEEEFDEDEYDDTPTLSPAIEEEVQRLSQEPYEEEYPEISKEDDKKVDDWWKKYKGLKNPDDIQHHIDQFIENNPEDVNINLGLEHEVLFELIAAYVRQGRSDDIFPYMMDFREKHPGIYIRSFDFYDADIIQWLLAKNRKNEIPKYFNLFEQYPVHAADHLLEIINCLDATGNTDIALPLIKKVYKAMIYSFELLGSDEIANPLINHTIDQYLNKEITPIVKKQFFEELNLLDIDIDTDNTYWMDLFGIFKSDTFETWNENIPKRKVAFSQLLKNISKYFAKFLVKNKDFSFQTADYYSRQILLYYNVLLDDKKPKNIFSITNDQIEYTIPKMCNGFFNFDATKLMSLLNALYYFAQYLYECKNYNQEQRDDLIKRLKEYHTTHYQNLCQIEVVALAFDKFPLFG